MRKGLKTCDRAKHNGIKPLFDCKLVLFRKFGYYQAFLALPGILGFTRKCRFYQEFSQYQASLALAGTLGITRNLGITRHWTPVQFCQNFMHPM